MRVLVLAGTSEARELLEDLSGRGIDVRASLAGRTANPRRLPAPTRVGGFGGIDGLAAHLRAEGITHLVDATHPYAARMPHHAVAAAARGDVAHVRLLRPPWPRPPGADVVDVTDVDAAAAHVRAVGARRVLLALGRSDLTAFMALPDVRVLIRSIDPPDLSGFADAHWIRLTPPLDVADERTLLRVHGVDAIVGRDAGGSATVAKLVAAAEEAVPVALLHRPPSPTCTTVPDAPAARSWLAGAGAQG